MGFSEDLRRRLTGGKVSLRAIARQVGIGHGLLSLASRGLCPFPVRHVERLADALKLTGTEREVFIVAACLDNAHPILRAYVERLKTGAHTSSKANLGVRQIPRPR